MANERTKWLYEDGMFFPISGDFTVHPTPGPGIWRVSKSSRPMDPRLGVQKLADRFEFDYKIYKLGHEQMCDRIIDLWNNEDYVRSGKNLGVIFNGLKGTGKTIAAKILCNRLDMPVLIINSAFDGAIVPFIQSINYECAIFIDEAEKIFNMNSEDGRVLLSLIDGVYNTERKLFILTTNTLSVNENLLGRPGRIRYIQEFRNLPIPSVIEYAKDNLKDEKKLDLVLQEVDLLEISTIDILKAIVEEINIFGAISPDIALNIPKAKYIFEVVKFVGCDREDIPVLEDFIKRTKKADQSNNDWYYGSIAVESIPQDILETAMSHEKSLAEKISFVSVKNLDKSAPKKPIAVVEKTAPKSDSAESGSGVSIAGEKYQNAIEALKTTLEEKAGKKTEEEKDAEVAVIPISDLLEAYMDNCDWTSTYRMTSCFATLWKDSETSLGTVIEPPSAYGLFLYSSQYDNAETLGLILKQKNNPSLYRGGLVF